MAQIQSPLLSSATIDAARTRLRRIADSLPEHRIDAILIGTEKDILYLTGFIGHDSLLLVMPGTSVIITDARYDEFLDPWRKAEVLEVMIGTRHRLEHAVKDLCRSRTIRHLGFQADSLTVSRQQRLAAALGDSALHATEGIVAGLRRRKDEHEIGRIEQAIRCQEEAMAAALPYLRTGMRELEFAARLEYEMKMRGALKSSFDPIIGAGSNSSIIHHQTGSTPIGPGHLLVDWGAMTPDGYNSDLTRTFCLGPMTDKFGEIYTVVLEAQLAAIEAARPGRTCAEIDAVARRHIRSAGFGDYFTHGLGHGLGLDVHESPYFNELQDDVVLEPGMVMTVEPGIYLPGIGGVRIEDDVLITESGSRVLSHWPKSPDSVVIEPGNVPASVG